MHVSGTMEIWSIPRLLAETMRINSHSKRLCCSFLDKPFLSNSNYFVCVAIQTKHVRLTKINLTVRTLIMIHLWKVKLTIIIIVKNACLTLNVIIAHNGRFYLAIYTLYAWIPWHGHISFAFLFIHFLIVLILFLSL